MSYTKSYIFGESTTIGFLTPSGHRNLLTLKFTIDDEGSDIAHLASDYGLKIQSLGKLGIENDFTQYTLIPQEFNFSIIDENLVLDNLLHESEDDELIEKDFEVILQTKYSNKAEYEEKFSGKVIVDSIDEDETYKTHKFTAMANSAILNQIRIIREDWDPAKFIVDNGTYRNGPNNPLGLSYDYDYGYIRWENVLLTDLIKLILQQIDSSIDVEYYNDWKYFGIYFLPAVPASKSTLSDLTINDIILGSNWIGSIFSDNKRSDIVTLGDLLARIGFEYGCQTIIFSNKKAAFSQLLYFDENNVQKLGNIVDKGRRKSYKFSTIEKATIKSKLYKQYISTENRYVEQDRILKATAPDSMGANDGLSDDVNEQIISYAFLKYDNGNLLSVEANTWRREEYTTHYIAGICCPYLDIVTRYADWPDLPEGYYPPHIMLANYYYNLRNKKLIKSGRSLTVDGIGYDYLKGFQLDSCNYKILDMIEDLDNETTELYAIKIKKTTSNVIGEETTTVVINPLAAYSMLSFGSEAKFSYTMANEADEAIGSFSENEWLEGFYINLDHVFLSGTITKFEIYDGSETLLKLDNIIGKLTQLVKPQLITRVKKYTAADTLYLHIEGSNPTQGDGQIIIRKMKRETT